MSKFISWSFEHFDRLSFTRSFWEGITNRLSLAISEQVVNDPRYRYGRSIALPADSSLEGIIAFLTKEHGGNVHAKGIVEVAASTNDILIGPSHLVDLDEKSYIQCSNLPNQWVHYDFKDRRVKLTDYSIAAHTSNWFLRSWVVEGSNDGEENHWTPLDSRTNNTDAHSGHPIATFHVAESEFYRFIRLRHMGKTANGHDYLILHGFEVFGFLLD
jgi:hypothetical protein